ncbi:MAG: amidohydrolase family protein [Flavobacteriaceae bacterium]|nr:amidohydrolase family protein [Flavobacteriaceae bacterium]
MKKILLLLVLVGSGLQLHAQIYFPKNDGVKQADQAYTAITHANIQITAKQLIKNATLLMHRGKVVAAGKNVKLPTNTVVQDAKGAYIYPSFVEVYSNFGMPKPKRVAGGRGNPQYDATREGYYWNDHMRSEQNAIEHFAFDKKKAADMRKIGFGVVSTHSQNGIARGTGTLVALNDKQGKAYQIIEAQSAQYFSFTKSVSSPQMYPSSLMGSIALLRQFQYDADWYSKGNIKTKDLAIEAHIRNKNLQPIFYAGDKWNVLRADKIGDEFGIQYTMVTNGDTFENIQAIQQTGATLVVPVHFPKAYDMTDPFKADYVSLEDMRYWQQAPFNAAKLEEAGIAFALTSHGLKKGDNFLKNVQKAIQHGLSKEKALEALTTVPARILGKESVLGHLQKGAYANFLLTSGPLFDSKTILYENWVGGQKHQIHDRQLANLAGKYQLQIDGKSYATTIKGKAAKPSIDVKQDDKTVKASIHYKDNWATILLHQENGVDRLIGQVVNQQLNQGKATLANGKNTTWTLTALAADAPDNKKKAKAKSDSKNMFAISYPNKAYGFKKQPKAQNILFKNATIWTSENTGVLQNTDLLIKNGKIAKIGKNLPASGAKTIDATGKHITAGIIDEHTHIGGTGGINEAGHNSTAEVSLEDVIDPENIGIYRNLAGGVTTMQLLHGSANPIGGRSAILKLKWGANAQELRYPNSPQFIKFALGENVKQSNWQSFARFPQTRMGVEQVFEMYFQKAKEYDALQKSGKPYRRDLDLEVIAQILNSERFISCHSYVQSEINMLMKVAERFQFKVNTFTHILEGYKLADKMKKHGVGGSTFSDWWAYKYEVLDAIPYNAAIMHRAGVITAINSDDAEMSRRLNQEAAKSVKYGGLTEEEALNMVTINPAKLLHIDHEVGSIKEGKVADVVLWSDHPLSVYAKAEKTLVDGIVYFDIQKDQQMRTEIAAERQQLTQLMLKEKNGGAPTQAPKKRQKMDYHCDTVHQ